MDKKIKEGMSIQELENFGKRYRFEIFFILYFLLATLLTFLFFGATWSIFLAGIGGILGVWLPSKVEKAAKASFQFIYKQEKITRLILAVAGAIVAFFLPPVVFFVMGLMGGAGINRAACSAPIKTEEEEKSGGGEGQ